MAYTAPHFKDVTIRDNNTVPYTPDNFKDVYLVTFIYGFKNLEMDYDVYAKTVKDLSMEYAVTKQYTSDLDLSYGLNLYRGVAEIELEYYMEAKGRKALDMDYKVYSKFIGYDFDMEYFVMGAREPAASIYVN